jgi:hypothetical protein
MIWEGHWETKYVYKSSVGKLERKTPFRRPRLKWEDVIEMELKETRYENVGRIKRLMTGCSGELL